MLRVGLLALVLSAGCNVIVTDHCDFCSSGPPSPRAAIYDNGTTLTIAGCMSDDFGECSGGGTMAAAIAGQLYDVPAVQQGPIADLATAVALGNFDHRLDLPSPTNGSIWVDYDGASELVSEPPPFAVAQSTAADGTTTFDFPLVADSVSFELTQGEAVYDSVLLRPSPGRLVLDSRVVPHGTYVLTIVQSSTQTAVPPATAVSRGQALTLAVP